MRKLFFKTSLATASLVTMSLMNGCASNDVPLPTPDSVNIDQFMGRWYVHGYTPILVDKQAHNAIEHYRLDADYTETIIAHPSRKYAWIMLREPEVTEADYEPLL